MSKIENRIIEVRSVRVLVDYELADLYQVNLKILLQAVLAKMNYFNFGAPLPFSARKRDIFRSVCKKHQDLARF
jgi:hypothetical protein